ncbi:YopX family protein [Planomicrobium okeanokoites]|uniref:YopX family protein n=1 Tax=Planomicrobium okeanokoites TaxID=244 RepID=A0ABV7KT85_PLAOK|nr:YopX family protein [Planomicrobium okeanokoites]TAA67449.1 hypothetical protein D2910_13745 [Planomicrobium okeanokoites]
MREIKFRVWIDGYKMIAPFDLSQHPQYWAHELKDGVRLQYTGLNDVNGFEIYEGDVMRLAGYPDMHIVFLNGCFVGKSTNKIQAMNWVPNSLTSLNLLRYEVIGNVYQNPELLEVSTE